MNDMLNVPPIAREFETVIAEITAMPFETLDRDGITAVAWAYYYFSVQFRENLQVAARLYPDDPALPRLVEEECDTDNLSPWPGVAEVGEKMDHDEFMRRVLLLSPIDPAKQLLIETAGHCYLDWTRTVDDQVRAMSISSYENGGLETVFTAMLRCQCWDTPLLQGFRHFLVKHIGFDSNPEEGHGALVRHIAPDDRILTLWEEFRDLLLKSISK